MIKALLILLLVALASCATTPTVGPPTVQQLPSIPSNFNVTAYLTGDWGGSGYVPPENVGDDVGAFRFLCQASHESYDDPVVYPNQPGKSHLHQFYGNTLVDASSTYETLRKTGNGTCNNKLNRSGYWIPAMLDGKGGVIRPDYVSVYYKRYPANSPKCFSEAAGGCVRIPRGLRFIFGYDVQNKTASEHPGYFNCQDPNNPANNDGISMEYPDIIAAGKNCSRPDRGYQLGMVISAPNCWDGKNLDSKNHRDHMSYLKRDVMSGQGYCPSTHPYILPTFTLGIWYTIDANLSSSGTWDGTPSTWHLSSDIPADGSAMQRPGTTLHADWFGAWDDDIMDVWHDNCIDKKLNCNGGELGDGTQLLIENGYTYHANPRVVPVPPKPNVTPAPTGGPTNPPSGTNAPTNSPSGTVSPTNSPSDPSNGKSSASTFSPLSFLQLAAFAAVFYNML